MTPMTIISSALMQPTRTLSWCPSSPVSSLKGQLDTCPTPRHQSLKLSPIKTTLSNSSLSSLWREGGRLKEKESPYQRLWIPLTKSPNPNSGGRHGEVCPLPTSWAGTEGTFVGTGGQPMAPQREADLSLGLGCSPQPAQITPDILCGTPGSIYS